MSHHFRIVTAVVAAALVVALSASTEQARAQGVASIYSAVSGPTLPQEQGEEAENYVDPSDFLLDREGKYFFVSGWASSQLRRVRADGSENAEILPLDFKPFKMRFLSDETRVAIVGGEENGKLAIVEIADAQGAPLPLRVVAEYQAGHSPADVSVRKTADGVERVYVADRFHGKLLEIDPTNGETTRFWEVGREPFCIEPTPDGKKLVVADRITEMKANQSFSCAKVFVIDLDSGEMKSTALLNGHNTLEDIAISADGKYAFIAAVQCSYLSITSQVSGGWTSENCVLAVDVDRCELIEVFFLDDAELGAGNPWGVAISDDGERLIVSIAGTDEIAYLPLKRLFELIQTRPEWARPGYGAYSYASFAKGEVQLPFRLRVKFGFKGLRQLIARGDDVYALSRFDDVICKATLKLNPPYSYYPNSYVKQERPPRTLTAAEQPDDKGVPRDDSKEEAEAFEKLCESVAMSENVGAPLRFTSLEPRNPMEGVVVERSFARLAPKPVLTTRRRGEIVFHDATACFENWLSCVTCHPDARVDGFNWDLLNDGTGNLKNAKSMLLSHETPPSMISGIRADAETAVRAGFVHILFMSYKEENACCVDDYLSALKPLPSPYLVDGKLSESAERGKTLFESEKIGCSVCHPAPYFTDMRLHNVQSQDPNDFIDKFDTPTLIEVWRTAPYMNTGEYTTIRALFEEGNHGFKKKDFNFTDLPKQEQDDLIEYVLSL